MSAHTSEQEPAFIEFTPPPETDEGHKPKSTRDRVRLELRDLLDHVIQLISNGRQKGMRYTPAAYAKDIVVKCGHMIVGWPSEIPFRNLSNIGGGAAALLELQRLWNLPEGDPARLRFERASDEVIALAASDPESVHPNREKLDEEREAAAAAAAETEAAGGPPKIVPAHVFHPDDLEFVGVQLTSTDAHRVDGDVGDDERSQRIDMGRRRRRAVDLSGETRIRKLPAKRGITTPRFVLSENLQGVEGGGGGGGQGGRDGERAAKRVRMDERRELAVDDRIDQFLLSSAFGGAIGIDELLVGARG